MSQKGQMPRWTRSLREVRGNPALSVAAAVTVLVFSSIYCVLPLLTHRSIPMGHDMIFHIFQSDQFQQGVQSGSVYPRWAADANNGYGSPNFIFYSPLAYYLVFFVRLWEPSPIMSIVYVIWAGFLLSGVTMLFATRKMFGKPGSLLAAVVYQLLPFHIIDLYHRGTFAELLAYSVLPLFFYFLMKTSNSDESRVSMEGLALSYAGLILTHLVTGFIFSVFAGVYLLYGLYCPQKKRAVFKTAVSLLVGLGISAVYLGPAVLERKFVHIGWLAKYSAVGIFLFDSRAPFSDVFFRFLYITVTLEAVFFLLIFLAAWKSSSTEMHADTNRFLYFAFIGAFFLTTPFSGPVWHLIPQFASLQFPWRWIIVMELSLCFLIAGIYSLEKVRNYRPASFLKTFILILVVSLAQVLMQYNHDAAFSEDDLIRFKGSIQGKKNYTKEYLPIWTTNPTSILTWTRSEVVEVMSGQASVHVAKWDPEERSIKVQALSDSVIRIATLYYPGWEFTQDGENADMDVEGGTGAVLIHVPSGAHTIRATFRDTRLRMIAKYIALMSLLFLIPVSMLFGGSIGSKGRSPSK